MNFKSITTYLNAAALLAIVTALLFFLGYVYYSAYFGYFGVNLSRFLFSSEKYYLLVGSTYAVLTLGTFLTILFMYKLFVWTQKEEKKPAKTRKKNSDFVRTLRQFAINVGPSALLLLLFLGLSFAIIQLEIKGRRDARDMAFSKKQIEFVTKTENKYSSPLYFLAFTEGKYFVYSVESEGKRAQVHIINESDISQAVFINP